jgi:hypothetical protein
MLGFGQVPVTIPDANFKAYLVGNTHIIPNGFKNSLASA